MLDSESKKRLIEQSRVCCAHKRRKFEPGDYDTVNRRKHGDDIKQGEQLYRAIFDGSRDAIFLTAADASFVEVNEAASVLTGYSPEELENMNIPDLHEEEDTEAYRQFFHRIMAGEQLSREARILRKDGSKIDTEFSNRKIMLGDAAYMHTVARDITERKRAEEALRKAHEELEERVRERTAKLEQTNKALQTKVAERKQAEAELREYREHLEELIADRTRDLKKSNERLEREIAEHKQAEEALRDTSDELVRVMSSVSDYLWSADVDEQGRVIHRYYSPVVEKITGRPPEYYMSGPARWLETVHPGDRPRLERTMAHALTGQEGHVLDEYRITLPDGAIRWIRDSVTITQLGGGKRHLDGVATDITERKQTQQRLLDDREQLKSLASQLSLTEERERQRLATELHDHVGPVSRHVKGQAGPTPPIGGPRRIRRCPQGSLRLPRADYSRHKNADI